MSIPIKGKFDKNFTYAITAQPNSQQVSEKINVQVRHILHM